MRRMAIYSTVRLKREPGYKRRYLDAHRFIQRMDGEDAQQDANERRWGRPEALELMGSGDGAVVGEVAMVWLDRALARLTEREQSVLKRYYGIGCEARTDQQIAVADGLSRERIRQVRMKALRNLRGPWHCTDAEENGLMTEGCWAGFGWRPVRRAAWRLEEEEVEEEVLVERPAAVEPQAPAVAEPPTPAEPPQPRPPVLLSSVPDLPWVAERRQQDLERIDPRDRGIGAGPWREPEARKNLPEWLRRLCQQAFGETDDASGAGEGEQTMSGKRIVTDKSMIELGARVKKIREASGLSQDSMAAMFAVSDKSIMRIESGLIRSTVNLGIAKKIDEMGATHWRERWSSYKAKRAAESVLMNSPTSKPAPARKAGLPRGQHTGRTCPVCGKLTKAPRYRYLCEEHRTPENLAKFARKVGKAMSGSISASGTVASAPVVSAAPATTPLPGWLDGRPTDLEEALKKMERMRDMFAGIKPPAVAPAPAPSSSVAISKGVVLLALNTLKEETKFAGLAELALAALEDL